MTAEPLNTSYFRESWDVLKDRLRDVPKETKILTYCTGGIRCIKVCGARGLDRCTNTHFFCVYHPTNQPIN